jgi:NADH:ubiquinone oxidoreductase subunit 6 (subunit J)
VPGKVSLSFAITAAFTIAGAIAALTLRNLVHCVLALVLTFTGLAGLYLQLGAQFVGFAQILIYVGAVAILIVFAILLTRSHEPLARVAVSPGWVTSILVTAAIFGILAWSLRFSAISTLPIPSRPQVTVRQIGDALMSQFVLPLEVIGLLLTAALVGAVTIAMHERRRMK